MPPFHCLLAHLTAQALISPRASCFVFVQDLTAFFQKYPVDTVGRMATINSFLKVAFPVMWFVGFYVVAEPGKLLAIGPYQGPVLATGLIVFGKGQCGACAEEQRTQIQEDVSQCKNYIGKCAPVSRKSCADMD